MGLDQQSEQIAAVLRGGDARLRGDLIASVMIGVRIGRDLLGLARLSHAPPELILRLVRPVFEAIIDADGGPAEHDGSGGRA